MLFEYDQRARRWSVSHDRGKSWDDVPGDGPSEYMRRYERRHPPREAQDLVE